MLPRHHRRTALAHALVDDGREHRDVASAAGIAPQQLGGILSGRVRNPRPATRRRIAATLGRTEAELFPEYLVEVRR